MKNPYTVRFFSNSQDRPGPLYSRSNPAGARTFSLYLQAFFMRDAASGPDLTHTMTRTTVRRHLLRSAEPASRRYSREDVASFVGGNAAPVYVSLIDVLARKSSATSRTDRSPLARRKYAPNSRRSDSKSKGDPLGMITLRLRFALRQVGYA